MHHFPRQIRTFLAFRRMPMASHPLRSTKRTFAFGEEPHGGAGGIRTHGTVAGPTVFKTVAFDHSATAPGEILSKNIFIDILCIVPKLPLIITAPHAHTTVPLKYRRRMQLSTQKIWQCSDPFTNETCQHPKAAHTLIGTHHRLLGDVNREPTISAAFRESDFYNTSVWRQGQQLSEEEKKELLLRHWMPYAESVVHALHELIEAGYKKILLVDHHNTASDHPLNKKGEYIPSMVISNFGSRRRASLRRKKGLTTMPARAMKLFANELRNHIGLSCEINNVYYGGHIIQWVARHVSENHSGCTLYAVQFEYNLNYIWNPLSGKVDDAAKQKINRGFVRAVDALADFLKLEMR